MPTSRSFTMPQKKRATSSGGLRTTPKCGRTHARRIQGQISRHRGGVHPANRASHIPAPESRSESRVKELDVFASTDESHYVTLKKQERSRSIRPGRYQQSAASLAPTRSGGSVPDRCVRFRPDQLQHQGQAAPSLATARRSEVEGKVTLGHPAFSGYVGNWVVAMNDKYGWEYFTKHRRQQSEDQTLGQRHRYRHRRRRKANRAPGPTVCHSRRKRPATRSTSTTPTTTRF